MNAELRKFMLNVTLWPDADHGCQRSTVEALQSAQLFDFLILMMVTFNLPHGPHNNDVRWNQILGVEDALAQRHNARSCVLFQAHVVDMINELRETGTELPGEKDADLEVWDLWLRRRRLRNKGDKIMLNRYSACSARINKEMCYWSMDTFELEYLAIELDMLKSKKMAAKLVVKTAVDPTGGEGGGPTGLKTLHIEDKSIRGCAHNAVCIAVKMRTDYDNYRICKLFLSTTLPVKDWRTTMVRECRSADGTRDYFVQQIVGGAWKHCTSIMEQLTKHRELEYMDFAILGPLGATMCLGDGDMERDEDFALLAWRLHASMFCARTTRLLYLMTPPHSLHGVLDTPISAKRALSSFKLDRDIYKKLSEGDANDQTATLYLRRHLLNTTSAKQNLQACEELGFGPVPREEFVELMDGKSPAIATTHLVEEVIGYVKNYREAKCANRFRRPEVCMARALSGGLLKNRFTYKTLDPDVSTLKTTNALEQSAFVGDSASWSLPWKELQSANSTADWYSPSASNLANADADISQLRNLDKFGSFNVSATAKLNTLFHCSHSFAFECLEAPGKRQWVVPMKYFDESAVLAIKCKPTIAFGSNYHFFELDFGSEPYFFSVTALTALDKAAPYVPHCPAWAWKNLTRWRDRPPAVRIFRSGAIQPVLDLACDNAFWLICKTEVRRYADHLKIYVPSAATLIQTLVSIITTHKKVDDAYALRCCHKRLMLMKQKHEFSKELLNIDEAVHCLDFHDHQVCHASQKATFESLIDEENFEKAFYTRRRELTEASGGGAGAAAAGAPLVLPLAFAQSDVNKFVPPDTKCWRGNLRGEWWGFFKHAKSVGMPISRYDDERSAIVAMLQRAWKQYNFFHGLPLKACPKIPSLFNVDLDPDF